MPAAYAAGPAATPSDSLPSVTLEELSVTAVKQRSILREQPVAATLLTGAQLDELNVVTIKGISDVVPNFYIPDYGSRITSTIYVRGLGARMDQPAVGLSVDNVPFLNKDCYDFDIADIVSVDMLRGPQSTLYGRNTMGGQINVTTLSPMRYQGWRLNTEIGTGGNFKLSTGWYHKFHPDFAFAAVGSFTASRGFFTNEYNGRKIDRERLVNLRLKQDWRVTRSTYLQNALSANFLRQGGYPYEFKETGQISYNDTCFYHRLMLNDGLTVRHNGEKVYLTSITSWQYIDDNMTLDQDFLPEPYFTLTQKKREHAFTEDFVVKGREAVGPWTWLAGAFAFYKHLDMHAPVTFLDSGIRELIENHVNQANPLYPIRWNSRDFKLNSDFTIPTWGLAVYHESKLDFDRWHFSAGLRLDYERASMNYHSHCDTGYTIYHDYGSGEETYANVPIKIDDRGDLKRDFLTLLPKFTAMYDLNDGSNVYVNIAKGYKAGGFNTQMFSDVLQQRLMSIMGIGSRYEVEDIVAYKPESSWNYEAGAHFNFAGGKLMLDLAAFYIDCRNQQLTMFPDGTTTGRIMTNAGKTRSFGAEVTMMVKPFNRMTINASYGYTNAKFRDFFNGKEQFKGNWLPYVPKNTVFLQGLYSFPGDTPWLKLITFDVNLRATGDIYWNEQNTERQDMYLLLGAAATFTCTRCEFQLWGRNLTAIQYKTFYFLSMGNAFFQRGVPRQIGLTFRMNF